VVIPAATNGFPVTSIGEEAFVESLLTSVTIPNSVTSIGDGAFTVCASLTSATIGTGVTNIGEGAFAGCTSLTSVTIGNGVTSIGIQAFYNCRSLTSVTIPNSVTSIGEGAFFECTNLTSVTIGTGVTNIGDNAFAYCISLTSATIPDSVTSIGDQAFRGCSSLTNVTIPNSVTSIGEVAFLECTSLKSAYFQGNAPPDNGNAFSGDPATVYYLSGTTGWGPTFGSVPTALWNPQANTLSFASGHFGFNLTGPTNAVIVVEACTNLSHAVWLPVATNTFSGSGTSAFSDFQSGAHPTRFYRVRSP